MDNLTMETDNGLCYYFRQNNGLCYYGHKKMDYVTMTMLL